MRPQGGQQESVHHVTKVQYPCSGKAVFGEFANVKIEGKINIDARTKPDRESRGRGRDGRRVEKAGIGIALAFQITMGETKRGRASLVYGKRLHNFHADDA